MKTNFKKAKTIVVKIGTSLITNGGNKNINKKFFTSITKELAELNKTKNIVLVSSGAIGLGMKELNLAKRPYAISDKQAVAAIGQPLLMDLYSFYFKKNNMKAAQVLLTHSGLQDRKRYLNATNTIKSLFKYNVIPIINENDTVATEEIQFGDNDTLSSLVSILIDADLLVLLTDTDGLYKDVKDKTSIIREVQSIDKNIENYAKPSTKEETVGGFSSKIGAGKIACNSGVGVLICNGNKSNSIINFLNGETIGTFFHPKKYKIKGKKRYIAFNLKRRGKIFIDTGAVDALTKRGKSLLPSGIIKVEGKFERGDCISIICDDNEIGCGISNYDSISIDKIFGLRTKDIKAKFSEIYKDDEVIHRNNLVVLS